LTPVLLNRHKAKFHENNRFACSYCPFTYKQKTILDRHIASAHKIQTHPCPHCGKKFKVKAFMKNHIRKLHPNPGSSNVAKQHFKKEQERPEVLLHPM